ncbi:zinc finger protein 664-like [Cydia pomonella]|uniref:zinc finger protein 664-like n=1 Tax=Cydia pomonella TaxID=82600 RepID=UPI002ADDAC91|nr:zinc finger protein 664-like [Cydia pomonella]
MSRNWQRERHMEKVELWVCKICDKDYTTKSSLNRHFSTVHEPPKQKQIQYSPRAMVPYRAPSPDYVCHICGNDFASQGNLTRHLNTIHGRGNTSVSNSTKMVHNNNQTNIYINMYKPRFYN